MDPLKTAIAKAVQDGIVSASAVQPIKDDPALEVTDIEVQFISQTENLIRIKTQSQGIRYFRVKISEMLL